MANRIESWLRLWSVLGMAVGAVGLGMPARAGAFCGFYVAGADTNLYANATMVVLMRDGTRTVLSMQNNYQGPPEKFALVIPVPSVLTQEQVKILPKDVFSHVDKLGAPRLVEYWEADPCTPPPPTGLFAPMASAAAGMADAGGVKVEAMFAVGEYDVVVLSAKDSSGLDTWLRDNQYNIPAGADAVLAPYVAAGMKFFVAKVDPTRVTFVNGQAALSPLRFHYDTPDFSLPVRLGLLNSQGQQDLIVNILAPSRYEVANYPNVTVPTNLRVQDDVRKDFAGFYEALFSQLLTKNPGSVVTEYAWDSGSCDPCPTPPLDQTDLATLGADVTKGLGGATPSYANYTLTRLHYRYTKEHLGEDLVFKEAAPLVGGRGIPNAKGELETSGQASSQPTGAGGGYNNFQGRYVILHAWTNPLQCQAPLRGNWGGPDGSRTPMTQGSMNSALTGAAPKPGDLAVLLAQSLPALDVVARAPLGAGSGGAGPSANSGAGTPAAGGGVSKGTGSGAPSKSAGSGTPTNNAGGAAPTSKSSGCACTLASGPARPSSAPALFGIGLAWLMLRRRQRRSTREPRG